MIHGNQSEDPIAAGASIAPRGALPRALASVRQILLNMFGLDYRSLALLRISLGLCVLWVASTHAYEMRAFYTDEGVLPRSALFENPNAPPGFSLHFANGDMPYIATLFALQIVLAFIMLVGYRARLATIGSYVLLFSMQNRDPILPFGADDALRVGLFWMMFLPLSKCFSVDRLVGRTCPAPNQPYLGIAGIGFIVQVCIIYSGAALMKTGRTWQVDHTAVAYALALDVYSRPLGHWLGQFGALTRALTIITLKLELYGPVLFVLPVFSKWGRLLGIMLFAGLQLGFGLCMTMGFFTSVMISLSLVFLPPFFWKRIAGPIARSITQSWGRRPATALGGVAASGRPWAGEWFGSWIKYERNISSLTSSRPLGFRAVGIVLILARDGVLALLIVVMVLWNIGNIPGQPWRLTPSLETLGYAIGLNQDWGMFAPNPQTYDGWFVVAGTLRNGRTVDLMSGASPVSFDKPSSVAGSYRSQIWMAYLISYWDEDHPDPGPFVRYLRTIWDEHHSGDEQLESIEINEMSQTVRLGQAKSEVIQNQIWNERF